MEVRLKNIETGKTVTLTEKEYERFFDNRNPFDWEKIVVGVDPSVGSDRAVIHKEGIHGKT